MMVEIISSFFSTDGWVSVERQADYGNDLAPFQPIEWRPQLGVARR
jgi:hypothetical protein